MKPSLINRSIRWRLLFSMAGLGIVFFASLIIINIQAQNKLLRLSMESALSIKKEMLEDRANIVSRIMKERIEKNISPLNTLVISNYANLALANHHDMDYVRLRENASGLDVMVTFQTNLGLRPGPPEGKPSNGIRDPQNQKNGAAILEVEQMIALDDRPWGSLRIGYTTAGLAEQLDPISTTMRSASESLINRSIRISILFIGIGISVILLVSARLADPIVQLTRSAQEIARGNFSATRNINTRPDDEIGKLSRAFVKMSGDLQTSYSELKRTAEEARHARTFLDSVLDNLPHIIFVKDAKDLKFVLINRAGETILSHPRHELIGKSDSYLFGSDLAAVYFKRDRHVLDSGQEMEIPEGIIDTPNGKRRYFRTRLIPITEEDGTARFLLGIAEDITTQKSAAEERRLFFNHSLDLMCIASVEGHFEQVNPAFVSTLGYSAEELCSRPYFDFVHPDDLEGTNTAASKLNDGEIVVSFQNRYICRDGSIRWLTWNAGIDREFKKIYAVARDVTDQRDTEERIFQAGVQEQERIARDLHDGLGQILTALAFKGKLIEQMLHAGETLSIKQAADIVTLANRASEQARFLARGLDPVVVKEGLIMALRDLAHTTTESFDISCTLEHDEGSETLDKNIANHLYRIAQEAVNNALKHGSSRAISMYVSNDDETITLTILNDGLVYTSNQESSGLGIHTMNYRAKLIGGALNIIPNPTGGLIVRCTVRKKAPPIPREHYSIRSIT